MKKVWYTKEEDKIVLDDTLSIVQKISLLKNRTILSINARMQKLKLKQKLKEIKLSNKIFKEPKFIENTLEINIKSFSIENNKLIIKY